MLPRRSLPVDDLQHCVQAEYDVLPRQSPHAGDRGQEVQEARSQAGQQRGKLRKHTFNNDLKLGRLNDQKC